MAVELQLLIASLILVAVHFYVPLAYYFYMVRVFYRRSWGLSIDRGYAPSVSIVVPTYNEAEVIERKLRDIYRQSYPRDRVEVVVVDSASTDGTADIAEKWSREHSDMDVKIVRESTRMGKGYSLNKALRYVSGEIIVITDADSFWAGSEILSNAVKWFSDPSVGAVSCIKIPEGATAVEREYRGFYNILRVSESKLYATPVFHGELAAFRRTLLEEIGGFPTDIGADDSYTATKMALKGFRAIIPEDVVCIELVPRRGYHRWRIRRAQHLIQHFSRIAREMHTNRQFTPVLLIEMYLHLVNPWLLLTATLLLIASSILSPMPALAVIAIGLALLASKTFRTWIATQTYLLIAAVRNLWTRELVWEKIQK